MDEIRGRYTIPEKLLQRRRAMCNGKEVDQVQVQWSGMPSSHATWENEQELQLRFKRAVVWGQPAVEEGRDVMGLASPTPVGDVQPKPMRRRRPNSRVIDDD